MTSVIYTIDNKLNPSLDQFSIILSFFSNFYLAFTNQAESIIIQIGNELSNTGKDIIIITYSHTKNYRVALHISEIGHARDIQEDGGCTTLYI